MISPPDQGGITVRELEALTVAAWDAAEQGRWDVVADCYRRRGEHLQRVSLLPHERIHLLSIDRDIQERIGVAQAALTSVLEESARIRQRLEGLRQGLGATSLDSRMIRLEA